jgi:acyl-CoA thioester hydrolase
MSSHSKHHDLVLRVRYAETDQMGYVHHAAYLPWLEEGRTAWLRDLGYSYATLEASGQLLVLVDATIRYRRPAKYDDEVLIRTTLTSVGKAKVEFEYVVSSPDGETVYCTARTLLGSIKESGRPAPLRTDLREALSAWVVD